MGGEDLGPHLLLRVILGRDWGIISGSGIQFGLAAFKASALAPAKHFKMLHFIFLIDI